MSYGSGSAKSYAELRIRETNYSPDPGPEHCFAHYNLGYSTGRSWQFVNNVQIVLWSNMEENMN
jgi:hypothetical protein